jgi:hypothetical protein
VLAGHLCSQARRVGSSVPDLRAISGEDRILQETDPKRKRFLVEVNVPPCDQDAPAFSAETGQGVAAFGMVGRAIPVEVPGVLAVLAFSSRRVDAQSHRRSMEEGKSSETAGLSLSGFGVWRGAALSLGRERCRTESSESEP